MSRAGRLLRRTFAQIRRLVPPGVRRAQIRALMQAEAQIGDPEDALSRLFHLSDDLARIIDQRAIALGEGEHPRHRLTGYHDFFIARIPPGANVLEMGCGRGTIARSIANRVADARVTGIDIDPDIVDVAKAGDNPANLTFLCGETLFDLPAGSWDVVVLSNVLERLGDRIGFLRRLQRQLAPPSVLIRVPLFERGWEVALRRELDLSYFADPAHVVEHTRREFRTELAAAGLMLVEMEAVWGEIRAICEPVGGSAMVGEASPDGPAA